MVKMALKIAANRMAVLAVAGALAACGKPDGASTDASGAASGASSAAVAVKPSLSVQLVRPQRQDWPLTLSAHGAIAPWQEAIIGAEVSGLRLTDVLANVGDVVRRGQLLASLRADSLQADLAASRASAAEAQALLQEARANAERARALRQSDAVSAQEAQRAFTSEQTALARVAVLQAQVVSNELRLAQSRILAPDDGVISARQATAGTMVQPGQELFRLIRQSRLEWRAEVAAADVARLKPGLVVSIKAPGTTAVQGRVRSVAPTVDAVTRNGLVYVDLPVSATQSAGVRPGMFASGSFELSRASALTVPQSAVLLRDGFSLVFAVKGGKVSQTKVQIGRRQGDRIEVLQGITPETDLVASGVGFLVDGETVRVVPAAKP